MNANAIYQSIARLLLVLIVGTVLLVSAVATISAVTHHAQVSTSQLAGRCGACN